MNRKLITILLAVMMLFGGAGLASAKTARIAWSHYTGWEVWQYIKDSGIMAKWAKKYGYDEIEIVFVGSYPGSIDLYNNGDFDGCTMTVMDALMGPAINGIDSTVLIVGDFSNGNDGIVLINGQSVKDLFGRDLLLVPYSVTHYMVARALGMNGMTERDLNLISTDEDSIVDAFKSDARSNPKAAAATWNPFLMSIREVKNANLVFDSSKIPGEIIDTLVVRTDADEGLKRALVGAWYDAMKIMSNSRSKLGKDALKAMAKSAGVTPHGFKSQLKTTRMFYSPNEAVRFVESQKLKKTMNYVREFIGSQRLYIDGSADSNVIGIQFSDDSIVGDPNNVKLRFPSEYMEEAGK
ncbi:putative urea ABC transporter substrate-binding protein [Patescibacteria group bacterium]